MGTIADLLDRPVYGIGQVDGLVGLSGGTARRWIEGYSRGDRTYPPVVREEPTGSELVTAKPRPSPRGGGRESPHHSPPGTGRHHLASLPTTHAPRARRAVWARRAQLVEGGRRARLFGPSGCGVCFKW
jgi:hypothetical protein